MSRVNLWFRFLVVISIIVIGTTLVRSITDMLHDLVRASAPQSLPDR